MAFAEKFTALGAGNGFPFCVDKGDVSGEEMWITLGGTQKGSAPTQEEIDLSYRNAMQIFWNSRSISSSSTKPNGSGIVAEMGEPKNRVCDDWFSWKNRGYGTGSTTAVAENGYERLEYHGVYIDNGIFRMYNGSTDNESNFVGYGVSGNFCHIYTGADPEDMEFYFCSYVSGLFSGSPYWIPLNTPGAAGPLAEYSTALGDFPLIAVAYSLPGIIDDLSIEGLTATYYIRTLTFSNLQFYTYEPSILPATLPGALA